MIWQRHMSHVLKTRVDEVVAAAFLIYMALGSPFLCQVLIVAHRSLCLSRVSPEWWFSF